jgi:hypothetical protein
MKEKRTKELMGCTRSYVHSLLEYSTVKTISDSAFERDVTVENVSTKILDYATQVIEERTEAEYDIQHTGLTAPGYLVLETVEENSQISKKGNMTYWDEIDALAEGFVKALVELSTTPVTLGNEFLEPEDDILEMGKMVTEFAISLLQDEFGAVYPYVEENY